MQRDPCAYLHDILDAASAIDRIVWGAIATDLPLLAQHCARELQHLNEESS